MKLALDKELATNYKSVPQKARVVTEAWVGEAIFCPNCGYSDIEKYPNNQPVSDFYVSVRIARRNTNSKVSNAISARKSLTVLILQ